jgi:hypothetical protein
MSAHKPRHGASRRPRHGATRRRTGQPRGSFDRWLDRLVIVAVTVALVVGGVALVVTLF